ncbi:MAG: hypothetical protein SVZ03_00265 [Spirochaetota bacterium]|nr:hypothetical protein [Spirochaetota bacterium]
MVNEFEKDYNDEVYSDEYYEQTFGEDELIDEDEEEKEGEEEENVESASTFEKGIEASFACEECDYRWEDIFKKDEWDMEDIGQDTICPMCGSTNITQI